jgi:hypothetical protein
MVDNCYPYFADGGAIRTYVEQGHMSKKLQETELIVEC